MKLTTSSPQILIKLGGSILDDEQLISSLATDIKKLSEANYQVILVHGGSKAINKALAFYNIQSEFIAGLRVTSAEAVKIIEMVLCGEVNQILVRKLNAIGVRAVGLSGADQQMLLCDYFSQQHGFVGEIKAVNSGIIKHILASDNGIPVIASIGTDEEGNPLNINADLAACHIANTLGVNQLIYLTDQPGIFDKEGKVFARLTAVELQTLIDKETVKAGMLIKVKAILASLKASLKEIHILNGNQAQILPDLILSQKKLGTLCTPGY